MEELRQKKQLLLVEHAKSEGVKQRINELSEYIHSENTRITEYDEKLVRKYIDQIKVYDDKFVICFKAKLEIVVNVNILLYKKWKIFLYNYLCYASAS